MPGHAALRRRHLLLAGLGSALGAGAPLRAAAQADRLHLEFDLRPALAAGVLDPQRDRVGLRGASGAGSPLSWSQSLPAEPVPGLPGRYRVPWQPDTTPSQPLPYKIKIDRPDLPDHGWEPGPNRTLPLPTPGAPPHTRAWGETTPPPPLRRTGTLERWTPEPPTTQPVVAPPEVQVWLPPGYAQDPQRRYPVLYLHDGQNVFDAAAAGAEWQVDEAAQALVLAGEIEPLIVVAMASGATRLHDYTPVAQWRQGQWQGGGAAEHGRYLVDTLKPQIDRRYRTRPGREDTAVGGSSLGALVSLWLLLHHAPTFGAAALVSPALWWAGGVILDEVATAPGRLHDAGLAPPRVWLHIGSAEDGGRGTALADARRLQRRLQGLGWPLAYSEQPGWGHDEIAWAAQVPAMLRHLHANGRLAPR